MGNNSLLIRMETTVVILKAHHEKKCAYVVAKSEIIKGFLRQLTGTESKLLPHLLVL